MAIIRSVRTTTIQALYCLVFEQKLNILFRDFQFKNYPKILVSMMATYNIKINIKIKMGRVLIPFSGIVYFLVFPYYKDFQDENYTNFILLSVLAQAKIYCPVPGFFVQKMSIDSEKSPKFQKLLNLLKICLKIAKKTLHITITNNYSTPENSATTF